MTVGFLWTFTVYLIMGGAIHTFGFSVFYSWIIGCLLAFVFQVTLRFPRSWFVGVVTFAGVSMSLAGFLYVLETRPLPQDMVVVFKPGTTIEQALYFGAHVLGRPSETGRGYALPEIVSAAGNRGGEGYEVSFWRGTTDAEREELREKLQKSPMVERIFDRPREQSR